MRRHWARGFLVVVVVALLAACGRVEPAAEPGRTATAPAAGARGGQTQPEHPTLRVETLDGARWDLAQQRGKWVLVNYWATWCGPCLQEMPELSALAALRQYISIIGLAYDDTDPEEIRAFLQQHPVTYPIARVSIYAPPEHFGVPRTLPTSWLLDPDGKVVRKYSGQVTARMIEDDIAARGGPKAG